MATNANDDNRQFQQSFFDIGYKEVHQALQDSENYYNQEIALPIQLPPVAFTHSFGRFNDYDGEENDEFEIQYLNKDSVINHYKINIKPIKYKIEFKEEQIDQTLRLKDGTEAIFSTWMTGSHLLVFEKNEWQYILSVDQRISDKVTQKVFVEIANSIQD
ncbi:hypothetical protein [Paenisporosarcina indica]|uniref:hypothetical protein n=1 Tax=Paenisporosarcina indica TaxID=650093 RepID=UPI001FE8B193|nr:hypothetical protein [Paenisporosarcina indica]